MNPDLNTIAAGGGSAALIVAIGYVAKMLLDWYKTAKGTKTTVVSDVRVANTILLQSLKEEREEVQRLSAEVAELRTQNSSLYQQMREQRKDYEREVAELRTQLQQLTRQVDAFQQRLRSDLPSGS